MGSSPLQRDVSLLSARGRHSITTFQAGQKASHRGGGMSLHCEEEAGVHGRNIDPKMQQTLCNRIINCVFCTCTLFY